MLPCCNSFGAAAGPNTLSALNSGKRSNFKASLLPANDRMLVLLDPKAMDLWSAWEKQGAIPATMASVDEQIRSSTFFTRFFETHL